MVSCAHDAPPRRRGRVPRGRPRGARGLRLPRAPRREARVRGEAPAGCARPDLRARGGDRYRAPLLLATAPAFAGDSGSPVVNLAGEVVGTLSAGQSGGAFLFAASIPTLAPLLRSFLAGHWDLAARETPGPARVEAFLAALAKN